MKKRIIAVIIFVASLFLFSCGNAQDQTRSDNQDVNKVTETHEQTVAETEPEYALSEREVIYAVENWKYSYGIWSMKFGELIEKTISNPIITVYKPNDAETKKEISTAGLDTKLEYKDNTYYVIVGGDVIMNPDVGLAYTEYDDTAIELIVEFDDNNDVYCLRSNVSKNVETCAAMIFSDYSDYYIDYGNIDW